MCDTHVLPSTHGVGRLRRIARGARGARARRTTATVPPSRNCTACCLASSPSSPRRRPPSRRARSGRPRGPRRRPRGSSSRCRVPAGGGQAPGASRADACATCPRCAEAWREGSIGVDAAQAIASARRHRTEASMARDEAMLVAQAAALGFEDFSRALSYWKQLADPDGAEAADEERKASRNVFLESSFSGHVAGPDDARPDLGLHRGQRAQPPGARPLRGRLCRGQGASRPHGPDRRAGPHLGPAPGRRPRRDGDAESPAPRPRASAPPRSSASSSATRPCTGASVSSRTAPCSPLRPSTPWMDSAYFERAIFSLGNRIDVSVRARLFTGGTRRAIELRDRICTHPYCYEPAENCQVDHIETYAQGGQTTQENGRLLCGFHNRLRNQRRPSAGRPAPAPAQRRRRPRPEGAGPPNRPRPPRPHPGCILAGRSRPAQLKIAVRRRFVAPVLGFRGRVFPDPQERPIRQAVPVAKPPANQGDGRGPCGWIVSPRASISTNCSMRLTRVSTFFALPIRYKMAYRFALVSVSNIAWARGLAARASARSSGTSTLACPA